MRAGHPFDYLRAGFELTRLGIEAQAVVTMRLMGMTGTWNTPFDESYRMWREKPPVFVEAMGRAAEAAIRGEAPTRVASAAIAPLSRDAAQNRKRLAARGPV